MAYPATPKTWVAGDVLTAAQLNAELRDALLAAFPLSVNAWTAYTPTLTQLGAVTKTVDYARYQRVGRWITVELSLTATGAGTAANPILVGLPVAAASLPLLQTLGIMNFFDASTGLRHVATANRDTASTLSFLSTVSTANSLFGSGGAFGLAMAAGDVISVAATYEAAA